MEMPPEKKRLECAVFFSKPLQLEILPVASYIQSSIDKLTPKRPFNKHITEVMHLLMDKVRISKYQVSTEQVAIWVLEMKLRGVGCPSDGRLYQLTLTPNSTSATLESCVSESSGRLSVSVLGAEITHAQSSGSSSGTSTLEDLREQMLATYDLSEIMHPDSGAAADLIYYGGPDPMFDYTRAALALATTQSHNTPFDHDPVRSVLQLVEHINQYPLLMSKASLTRLACYMKHYIAGPPRGHLGYRLYFSSDSSRVDLNYIELWESQEPYLSFYIDSVQVCVY
jgi:hypothetical protein